MTTLTIHLDEHLTAILEARLAQERQLGHEATMEQLVLAAFDHVYGRDDVPRDDVPRGYLPVHHCQFNGPGDQTSNGALLDLLDELESQE
jgi:hypothetical protein